MTLQQKNAWAGRLFVSPFVFGVIFFFLGPIVQSLSFMFSTVTLGTDGFNTAFSSFQNLNYIFRVDLQFTQNLILSITKMLWKVPVIVISSLFISMLLNSKFIGKSVVRAIFFMPVIVVSGVILDVIKMDMIANNTMSGNVVTAGVVFKSTALSDLLVASGFAPGIVLFFTMIADNIFDVLYNCGIPMLMFLAGLQTISPALYEAASVEGATKWESFWKITVPMIVPITLINYVYITVDTLTETNNDVMKQVLASVELLKLGEAAAMTWVYCAIVLLFLGLIFLLFSRSRSLSTD